MFPILLTKNNKLRNETKKIYGWSRYYVTSPPRLNSPCRGEGASHQEVSTRVRQREELN